MLLNEVQNEDKSIIQWEDENFGESICKAFGKDNVTYTDIESVTGIDIDSQYVVRVYSENDMRCNMHCKYIDPLWRRKC